MLFVAGAAIFWWFVARPTAAALGAVQDLSRIEEIRGDVRNDRPYSPPEDGLLAQVQVDRYVAVQETMRDRIEGRLDTLRARYEEIEARATDPSPAELARAGADVASILVEATRAQVDALNEQDFSLDEYRWVRSRVLEAAGYIAPRYDLAQLATGEAEPVPDERTAPPQGVPERNRELVEPHSDTIEETVAFAWFGL